MPLTRRLLAQGDATLTGTRQWWLYGLENVPAAAAARFEQLKTIHLQTSRAWALKEVFRNLWLCADRTEAQRHFDQWYAWAIRSRLKPVKKVARMCKRHLHNILTFFTHRLTNGPIEGLNNKIQGLIKKAFGYRNKERFKNDDCTALVFGARAHRTATEAAALPISISGFGLGAPGLGKESLFCRKTEAEKFRPINILIH